MERACYTQLEGQTHHFELDLVLFIPLLRILQPLGPIVIQESTSDLGQPRHLRIRINISNNRMDFDDSLNSLPESRLITFLACMSTIRSKPETYYLIMFGHYSDTFVK